MAMKLIALANQKGGIGKTTSSRHLFHYFVEKGLRTVAIDFDIQKNFTRSILAVAVANGVEVPRDDLGRLEMPEGALVASGLFDADNDAQPLEVGNNAFLIGADAGMLDVERADLDDVIAVGKARFAQLKERFDVGVIDTGPSISGLLIVALSVADFAVSPCKPDPDAIDGLLNFFDNVRRVAESGNNPHLSALGVLPNQVDLKRAFHRDLLKDMRDAWGDGVLPVNLYERAAIDQAKHRPVWRTEKGQRSRNKAATEMLTVCECISTRMGL